MQRSFINTQAIAALLLFSAANASGQSPNVDPSKLVLIPKGTGQATKTPTPPHAPAPPPYLGQSDYLALRPKLASLTNLLEAKLPPRLIKAANLTVPGNVVNIGFGTPPAGGGFAVINASVYNGNTWINGNPPVPYAGYWQISDISKCTFTAPIPGPGVYLMTVYLATTLTEVRVCALASGVSEYGPTLPVPVMSRKLMVIKEVTTASARELNIHIYPPQVGWCFVYSCDFMRIM